MQRRRRGLPPPRQLYTRYAELPRVQQPYAQLQRELQQWLQPELFPQQQLLQQQQLAAAAADGRPSPSSR